MIDFIIIPILDYLRLFKNVIDIGLFCYFISKYLVGIRIFISFNKNW